MARPKCDTPLVLTLGPIQGHKVERCKLASQIHWYPFFALGPIQGHKVEHCKLAYQIPWYPFFTLGPIQGYKVQHLLVTWGRLKRFFLFQP
jgi:hypothetical protein